MEVAVAEYLATVPVFVRRLDGEILYWSSGAQELYGYGFKDAVGRSSHQLLRTEFPAPLEQINRALKAEGRWAGLLRHTRADGGHIWTETRWRLREDAPDGQAVVVENNTDVTQRESLARELDHRVKNTLAVVQGLARLTLRPPTTDAVEVFERRLTALAEAHSLLVQRHWVAADLAEVIRQALAPFHAADRVSLDGEPTPLQPSSVVAYSLALHELATNAVKHGALSSDSGRVQVWWRAVGPARDRLHLIWRETGAPASARPLQPGFGARLLSRIVAAELGAPVSLRLEDGGLVCEFDGQTQKQTALADTGPGEPPEPASGL